MFEHHQHPLLPRQEFLLRLLRSAATGLFFIGIALGIGMCGYHQLEGMSWVDSYANASMILSGMGPLKELQTDKGKLFAGSYALFSGLAFITIVGVVLAPVAHRFLHKFHLQSKNNQNHPPSH